MTEQTADAVAHHGELHLRREALTMALYVSITLLAGLTATGDEHGSDLDVLALVWGTTLGLALAHWCAFGLAARLVDPATDHPIVGPVLVAQLAGAFSVAAVATAAVMLFPNDLERAGARFATAACVSVVAFAHIRAFGGSRARATRAAVVALVLAQGAATLKHLLGQ